MSSSSYYSTNAAVNAASVTSSSSNKYTSSSHTHKIENVEHSVGGGGGDEDVLHVVTNVYTIPIIKSSSDGAGPFINQSQEIQVSTSLDDDLLNSSSSCSKSYLHHKQQQSEPMLLGEPRVELQSKTSSHETRTITKRIIESSSSSCMDDHHQQSSSSAAAAAAVSSLGQDFTKSKFQIRSIVEIYENQLDADAAKPSGESESVSGFFKTSTQLNETTTKEVLNEPLFRGNTPTHKHTQTLSSVYCRMSHIAAALSLFSVKPCLYSLNLLA
jgi:hypothetical protein